MRIKFLIASIILFTTLSNSQHSANYTSISDPWIINTRFGLIFETPGSLKEFPMPIEDGYKEYVIQNHYYTYAKGDFAIIYIVMDTKFKSFDSKVSLDGIMNNIVNKLNGGNLTLNYKIKFAKKINRECVGHFNINSKKMFVRGFSYFNSQKRAFSIIGIGQENSETDAKLQRVFNSIKLD